MREQTVSRDLGNAIEFEVTPRYMPNDEFLISAQYRYRNKSEDTYSGTFQVNSADGTPLSLDAATLGLGTAQTEHQFGFAVTYSTVRGYSRRTARWPLELWYMHSRTLGGENVPRLMLNGIGLRIYRPIRGNSLRGAPSGGRPGTR